MKNFLFFLILLVSSFVAGLGLGRSQPLFQKKLQKNKCAQFLPTLYPLDHHLFCLFIYGRNNGAYLEKTLASAFSQSYEHFRIIYVDDGSDDASDQLASDFIAASSHENRVRFVRNPKTIGLLACLAQNINECMDREIILVLNGEDWLAHEWVLARLNQYYADPDLWLTFGSSCDYPTYQKRERRVEKEGQFLRSRDSRFDLSTFYTALFKKIKQTDLQYRSESFPASEDLAYMLPMLEMGKSHSQYISDILYICNREHLRECPEAQIDPVFETQIRSLPAYSELAYLEL